MSDPLEESGAAQKPKSKAGRPTKFRPAMLEQVKKLAKIGATEKEISDFLKISEVTLLNWKSDNPKFLRALKGGKKNVDDRVVASLVRRALGSNYVATRIITTVTLTNGTKTEKVTEHIAHTPADTTACIFWLKNRRRNEWRDVRQNELSTAPGQPLEAKFVSDTTLLLKDFYARLAPGVSQPTPAASDAGVGGGD
jgi:hypothetical protein